MHRFPLLISALFLMLAACGAGGSAPAHTALSGDDLSPFRAQFNADAGKVRAIFLASPT
jgi:hypothetical protein